LTITDISGRIVHQRTAVFQSGKNKITINADDLPGAGMFYYTITSGSQQETRRMIK